ncbi:MAG: hypothetical protein CBD84_02705 [Acidimicrobiaceae bacterium TMED224]|nr:MAG: hypothetical protein CBD84_02705 [Acidimicrobiaceae bacterium TMED224]
MIPQSLFQHAQTAEFAVQIGQQFSNLTTLPSPLFGNLTLVLLSKRLTATPRTRARIDVTDTALGFAITGRSGRIGFLQRLAVDPAHQRLGIGRSLVADALQWSHKRFVRELLVNTQITNLAAVSLYESMGFVKKRDGLAVLRWNDKS